MGNRPTGARTDFGALNSIGEPFMYVADSVEVARTALAAGRDHPVRIWWHRSTIDRMPSIARFGLIPGCWLGSGECAVFGVDDRPDPDEHTMVVELESPAPAGDVKAWSVPAASVRGFWTGPSEFVAVADVAGQDQSIDIHELRCSCALAPLCAAEFDRICTTPRQ